MENEYKPSMFISTELEKTYSENKKQEETEQKYLNEIREIINQNGDFENIEFLISECCTENGIRTGTLYEFTLWKKLSDTIQGNFNIDIEFRKQIAEKLKPLNVPITSIRNQNDYQTNDVEIENLSQLINLYHYTGIFDFIKSEYTIHNNDHTTMAKLFCYLSQTELKGKEHFNTIVSHIKNIDNAPKKILSEKGKRKFESICIELNITKRKKEHP